MAMSNEKYGDILMELTGEYGAKKAIEMADIAYVISNNKNINLESDDEISLHRDDDYYDNENDMEIANEIIQEIGKAGKNMASMMQSAKEDVEDMKEFLSRKAPLKNELAELRQKVERAFGKTELALKLLNESQGGQGIQEINQRIDYLEGRVRNGSGASGEASITEPTEKAEAYTPTYDLDHYDTQVKKFNPSAYLDYYDVTITPGTGGGGLANAVVVEPVQYYN